ncbi:MAG TPA: DUF4339 domain-containing protein [Coriobacteriia bacterium]|jgi:hypothetical protein
MQGEWFIGRDGASYGPYSWDDMRAFAAQGVIKGNDLVWAAHLPGYVPAKRIQDLMPSKRGATAPPAPSAPPWSQP